MAFAQDAQIGTVNFADPATALTSQAQSVQIAADNSAAAQAPFASLAPEQATDVGEAPRRLQLDIARETGPVDVSFSQRASIGADGNGDLNHNGRGSEVRVGANLVQERERGSDQPSVYAFVASDDQALTYRPGQRNEFGGSGGSFSLQDQVEIGDMSAGVTYERNGIQASLAYVEREVSTQVGNQNFSEKNNFAGVTLTMRH